MRRSLWRRSAVLTGAVLVLCMACGGAPPRTAGTDTGTAGTDTTVGAQPETSAPGSTETDATESPDATADTTDASDTTDLTDTTNGSSAGDGTTVTPSTTANGGGRATTSTVKAGGVTTSTTGRATTTTVRQRPTTTTVAPPPTTPPPTPAPTPPPTPAPTSPPRTIGACQQLSLDTVNGWRATLGRPALSSSSSLYNGACSWATHLAETESISHAPGVSGEVVAFSSGGCGAAFSLWLGSSGHYAVLTSALVTTGGIACVKDSEGTAWAVGRVA